MMRRVRADRPVGDLVRKWRQPDPGEQMLLAGGSVLGADRGLPRPHISPDPTRGGYLWVQDSSAPVVLPDDASGIVAFRQECWTTSYLPHPGFPSRDKGSSRPPQAPTNSRHIQHWAEDLDRRQAQHQTGGGARLIEVITQAGISFRLARIWPGVTRARERQLKNQGGASRRCPICHDQRPTQHAGRNQAAGAAAPAVPTRGITPRRPARSLPSTRHSSAPSACRWRNSGAGSAAANRSTCSAHRSRGPGLRRTSSPPSSAPSRSSAAASKPASRPASCVRPTTPSSTAPALRPAGPGNVWPAPARTPPGGPSVSASRVAMSAKPTPSSQAAASAVVAALEDAWAAVCARHPDVPEVVVILGAGSEARRGLFKWGHFAAARWQVAGTNCPEVLVSGEGLDRGAGPVLATVLHEAAHGLAATRGARTPAVRAAGTTSASPPSPQSSA
jgi:hypothetical protein